MTRLQPDVAPLTNTLCSRLLSQSLIQRIHVHRYHVLSALAVVFHVQDLVECSGKIEKYDVHTHISIIAGRDFVEESKQVGDTRASMPEPMLGAFYKVKLVQMLGYKNSRLKIVFGVPQAMF